MPVINLAGFFYSFFFLFSLKKHIENTNCKYSGYIIYSKQLYKYNAIHKRR